METKIENKKNAEDKKEEKCCSCKKGFLCGLLLGVSITSILAILILSFTIAYFGKYAPAVKNAADDQVKNDVKADGNILSLASIKKTALNLKLDANKFNKCLDDGKYSQKTKDQTSEGQKFGVNGTPATFINGYPVTGARDISSFKEIIDAILAGKDVKSLANYKQMFDDKKVPDPVSIDTSKDYVKGAANAKIMLVEYSDFECPYCKRHASTLEQLMKDYQDKIAMVYKNFPLPFHQYAQKAAEAAECAGEQGKFWEMHDKLFELK